MSYSIETVNDCTKKICFNFESLDLSKEIEQELREKQKNTELKGFRKGKAPISMVKQIYGQELEGNAINRFIQNEFFSAVEKEKIRVIGHPSFENLNYDSGKKC